MAKKRNAWDVIHSMQKQNSEERQLENDAARATLFSLEKKNFKELNEDFENGTVRTAGVLAKKKHKGDTRLKRNLKKVDKNREVAAAAGTARVKKYLAR